MTNRYKNKRNCFNCKHYREYFLKKDKTFHSSECENCLLQKRTVIRSENCKSWKQDIISSKNLSLKVFANFLHTLITVMQQKEGLYNNKKDRLK